MKSCSIKASVLLCTCFAASVSGQSVTYDVVAVSGQPAPGLPGLTLNTFFDARLNESREIVFSARLAGTGVTLSNERSVWVVRGGQLELLHRQDDPAPFALDLRFDGAPYPRINARGDIGFTSGLFDASLPPTPPQPTRLGLFTHGPSGPVVVDAESGFSLPLAPLNVAGDTAFVRTTGPTGATTLMRTVGGIAEVVLMSGEPAPVPTPGYTFAFIDQPTMNASGDLAFRASIDDGQALASSLWRFSNASLELVAWTDPRTLGPGERAFVEISAQPSLDDAGVVTFWARERGDGLVVGNDAAIWRGIPGDIGRLISTADPAPGLPNHVIRSLPRQVAANAFARIALLGHLVPESEPPSANSVIWRESAEGGTLELVIREGSAVPGLSGVVFDVLGPLNINHHGAIAFMSTLQGASVTRADRVALLAMDQIGRFGVIARTGDEFDLGGGVMPRIVHISLAEGAMQRGTGTFSADGTLIFELRFDDKSSAIIAATVGCRADVDGNGSLDIFDFIAFGNLFDQQHPRADFEPDTVFDIFDFLAFGSEFAAGCP